MSVRSPKITRVNNSEWEGDDLLSSSKYRDNSFRSRKELAEAILLGFAVLFFAIGCMSIILFASEITVVCSSSKDNCTVIKRSLWFGPGMYLFSHEQEFPSSTIDYVQMVPAGHHRNRRWEDEHETADEFHMQQCEIILVVEKKPNDISLLLKPIPCGESHFFEELESFIEQQKNPASRKGQTPLDVYYHDKTTRWPQFIGAVVCFIGIILGICYWRHVPDYFARFL